MDYIVLAVVAVLVVATLFGYIAKHIATSRNMNGGFWWGFLLGITGIAVVAIRPKD